MSTPSVTETVARQNAALQARLPFHDTQDFEDAERGRIGWPRPRRRHRRRRAGVWDNDAYAFLEGDAPPCVNPSLWRQGKLWRCTASTRSSRASTRCAGSTCRT